MLRVMANTIAEPTGKASRARKMPVQRGFDFLRKRAMVGGSPPANTGEAREPMSGKSPHERDGKKVAKMSMKEKRAAKRERREPSTFIKPRKAARV